MFLSTTHDSCDLKIQGTYDEIWKQTSKTEYSEHFIISVALDINIIYSNNILQCDLGI